MSRLNYGQRRSYAANRLFEAVVGDGEGDADEALAARAVGTARGDDDVGAVENELGKRGRGVTLGHAGPEIRSCSRRLDMQPDRPQPFGHEIATPLIEMSKADIVRLALEVGAPLESTWSCYRGGPAPCGGCDSCVLRAKGFAEAGVTDPALGAIDAEA